MKMTVRGGVVDPDPVGSSSFCRIRKGIQGMSIRIPADPDWYQFQANAFFHFISIYCPK
jgi:hypothetical protein